MLIIRSSGRYRRQDKELQRWTLIKNSSSAECTLCENGCQVAGLANRINGYPCACLNYATKANSKVRFDTPKGQVCRQGIVRKHEQVDGPSGWSGGFRLPESRMQKQCTTRRSSRVTVDAPKETGHYEPMSTVDLNRNMLGRSEERWQCTIEVSSQVAPRVRS